MTQAQKIIKYSAIAFAVFLVVSIVSGIVHLGIFLSSMNYDTDDISGEMRPLDTEGNILTLDIDVAFVNFEIRKSDSFKVETDNEYITYKQEGNSLSVKEKKHSWFSSSKNGTLIISIPENFIFDKVSIETGAGKLFIEELCVKDLDLDLGAGEVMIENLIAENFADIDGGAGKVTIRGGKISNLDFDMGIGELSLTAEILRNSKIDFGVGGSNITLLGTADDYKIRLDKGLGGAKIDGTDIQSGVVYGSGENFIDMDGGVGSIDIHFQNIE